MFQRVMQGGGGGADMKHPVRPGPRRDCWLQRCGATLKRGTATAT